jgi:hypothetical protein
MTLSRWIPVFALASVLVLGLGGCKKKSGKKTHCEQYAEMEVRCGDVNGEGVRSVAKSYCEKAQKDKDDLMGAMIALEAECANQETECDAYQACIEKAKQDNQPPGL